MLRESIGFLEAIFGAFRARDRVPLASVEAAEGRLGVKLPAALRRLYEATGSSERVHQAHNRLVALAEFKFHDGHLVFYEESQEVVVWGIDRAAFALADPPVEQGQFDRQTDAWTFYPEFSSVSEFACAQGAWQAVQGGLPFVGLVQGFVPRAAKGRSPRSAQAALAARLGEAAHVSAGMHAWLVDGGVAVGLPGDYVGLATKDAPAFTAAAARLGVELAVWDYATLRDER